MRNYVFCVPRNEAMANVKNYLGKKDMLGFYFYLVILANIYDT